jgi:hypothetical protein
MNSIGELLYNMLIGELLYVDHLLKANVPDYLPGSTEVG